MVEATTLGSTGRERNCRRFVSGDDSGEVGSSRRERLVADGVVGRGRVRDPRSFGWENVEMK